MTNVYPMSTNVYEMSTFVYLMNTNVYPINTNVYLALGNTWGTGCPLLRCLSSSKPR